MTPCSKRARLGEASRLRETLRAVETSANRTRKLLRDIESWSGATRSGNMDDVLKLADMVERLARHGQRLDAEEAIDLAERLELLLEVLGAEVDAILAS